MTAEIDIAKVLVRAIADPQTANTKIVVRYQAPTQNELVAAYEAASGRQLPCITVSNEQLEEQIKGEISSSCSFVIRAMQTQACTEASGSRWKLEFDHTHGICLQK